MGHTADFAPHTLFALSIYEAYRLKRHATPPCFPHTSLSRLVASIHCIVQTLRSAYPSPSPPTTRTNPRRAAAPTPPSSPA
ncbi:hypothetical protein HGRIS_010511 [Hohenbuehelia grisea]|uniref:Uncharacterized protein n=1 Tax=Hohenbuehelia grisea TaxID=104357 RepID=A0ABR3IXC9_9AGAR